MHFNIVEKNMFIRESDKKVQLKDARLILFF